MKTKAFTMVELLATLVIIGVIASIVVVGVTNYVNNSRNKTYASHEESLKRAAEAYFLEHSQDNANSIDLNTLNNEGYLDDLLDPVTKTKCQGNVTRTAVSGEYNTEYNYNVCLICNKYRSKDC